MCFQLQTCPFLLHNPFYTSVKGTFDVKGYHMQEQAAVLYVNLRIEGHNRRLLYILFGYFF